METTAPNTTYYATDLLKDMGIFTNPYFKDLQNGAMTLEGFRMTQEQFYFAVVFF